MKLALVFLATLFGVSAAAQSDRFDKVDIKTTRLTQNLYLLEGEGGNIGVISYKSHPTDRRKKQLVTNHKNLPNQVPVAVTQAMLNYYGDTVRQLRRSA